ncbi:hypothetical protein ABH906_005311 [Pseudomonas frederiksbergensis]
MARVGLILTPGLADWDYAFMLELRPRFTGSAKVRYSHLGG